MSSNAMPSHAKSSLPATARPPSQKGFENEGEGSRSAARNYDEATEQYVKSGRVEEAAKNAAAALDGPEGDELRKADAATRATVPDDERPTNPGLGKPATETEQGFQEPELMKDESEDRE